MTFSRLLLFAATLLLLGSIYDAQSNPEPENATGGGGELVVGKAPGDSDAKSLRSGG
jgi:hypothetical protein